MLRTKVFPRFSEHTEAVAVKRCCAKKMFLKFHKFHKISPVLGSLFNKVAGLKACNFIKNRLPTQVFSCQICQIFKNTYLEEHLRTTASKHRSSFLEVFCRSCCSALINAVMKYNFSAAVVQSWRVLHGNLLKIALHHRYFSKNFTTVAEQRY